MELKFWTGELNLAHTWTIARGSATRHRVVFVQLTDRGIAGLGEASPSRRYQENAESIQAFLTHVDPAQLHFDDIPGSMEYLARVAPGNTAAKGAINIALLDGAARRAGKALYDYFELGFREGRHQSSFSIGIDSPEIIRKKVAEAKDYPILKLKVGVAGDKENLAALREVAPRKTVRVDANEGWQSKEEALERLEWLASDKHIEFCEQPMPASASDADMAWLKARSPLPLMADESCMNASDIPRCAEFFHAVNIKLVKTAGISGAYETLVAARSAGLRRMLGCMIESSILISAAAHLAELTDYLDLDGNLLISNDPYQGPSARGGLLSFAEAPEPFGLRVASRQ
jgi:L-alanine-DL-glutamate epimerase-like enolase superfamily enzyme